MDRKRFISSVYWISLTGGRPNRDMPEMACLRRIPIGSMLKS